MTTSRARMRAVLVLLLAALAYGAPGPARAGEENAGTRTASFLANGAGPATLAMGGAALGLGGDLQGATHNSAALARVGETQFAFAHADLADQSAQEWAAVGARFRSSPWRWGAAGTFRDEGTIPGRDANNLPTTDVSAHSVALGVQLARPFGERMLVGGAVRYVGESIGESHGNGLSFDAGAQFTSGPFGFGLAGRDFGGGMRWAGQQWRMPATFGAGVAFTHPRSGLRLALDLLAPASYFRSVRVGGEWQWHERLALRGGWRGELGAAAGERLSGPTFGVGARAGRAWVDYAYLVAGDGPASHRVGLALRGGAGRPTGRPTIGPENAAGR